MGPTGRTPPELSDNPTARRAIRVNRRRRRDSCLVVNCVDWRLRGLARCARVASLALLAAGCTEYLDAGHNQTPDPCAAGDAGLPNCPPTGLLDNLVGYWRLDDGS